MAIGKLYMERQAAVEEAGRQAIKAAHQAGVSAWTGDGQGQVTEHRPDGSKSHHWDAPPAEAPCPGTPEPHSDATAPSGLLARCTVLAGANGAGKTSLMRALAIPGEFVNADEVARRLRPAHPEAAFLEAGRLVLRRLQELMGSQQDFVYETTLSSQQSISLMRRARMAGYEVNLAFVMLESPELDVRRVAQRVAQGGHRIPEPAIRRRFLSALQQLPAALALSHDAIILDNSGIPAHQLLAHLEDGRLRMARLDAARASCVRLAGIVPCLAAEPPPRS